MHGMTPDPTQDRYIASSRENIENLLQILEQVYGTFDKTGNRQKTLLQADARLEGWTNNFLKSTCTDSPKTLFPTSESIKHASTSLHKLIHLYAEISSKKDLYPFEQAMLDQSLPRTFHEMIHLCKSLLDFTNENSAIINEARKHNIVLLQKEIQETNKNLEDYRRMTQVNIIWHPNSNEFREFINDWITEIARVLTHN